VSFEEEFEILKAWYRQKCDENNEAFSEALHRGEIKGLDCELDAQHREDIKEYNRRLVLLKVKYGKELDEGDKELYDRIKETLIKSC
jgi:hypothetical protein